MSQVVLQNHEYAVGMPIPVATLVRSISLPMILSTSAFVLWTVIVSSVKMDRAVMVVPTSSSGHRRYRKLRHHSLVIPSITFILFTLAYMTIAMGLTMLENILLGLFTVLAGLTAILQFNIHLSSVKHFLRSIDQVWDYWCGSSDTELSKPGHLYALGSTTTDNDQDGSDIDEEQREMYRTNEHITNLHGKPLVLNRKKRRRSSVVSESITTDDKTENKERTAPESGQMVSNTIDQTGSSTDIGLMALSPVGPVMLSSTSTSAEANANKNVSNPLPHLSTAISSICNPTTSDSELSSSCLHRYTPLSLDSCLTPLLQDGIFGHAHTDDNLSTDATSIAFVKSIALIHSSSLDSIADTGDVLPALQPTAHQLSYFPQDLANLHHLQRSRPDQPLDPAMDLTRPVLTSYLSRVHPVNIEHCIKQANQTNKSLPIYCYETLSLSTTSPGMVVQDAQRQYIPSEGPSVKDAGGNDTVTVGNDNGEHEHSLRSESIPPSPTLSIGSLSESELLTTASTSSSISSSTSSSISSMNSNTHRPPRSNTTHTGNIISSVSVANGKLHLTSGDDDTESYSITSLWRRSRRALVKKYHKKQATDNTNDLQSVCSSARQTAAPLRYSFRPRRKPEVDPQSFSVTAEGETAVSSDTADQSLSASIQLPSSSLRPHSPATTTSNQDNDKFFSISLPLRDSLVITLSYSTQPNSIVVSTPGSTVYTWQRCYQYTTSEGDDDESDQNKLSFSLQNITTTSCRLSEPCTLAIEPLDAGARTEKCSTDGITADRTHIIPGSRLSSLTATVHEFIAQHQHDFAPKKDSSSSTHQSASRSAFQMAAQPYQHLVDMTRFLQLVTALNIHSTPTSPSPDRNESALLTIHPSLIPLAWYHVFPQYVQLRLLFLQYMTISLGHAQIFDKHSHMCGATPEMESSLLHHCTALLTLVDQICVSHPPVVDMLSAVGSISSPVTLSGEAHSDSTIPTVTSQDKDHTQASQALFVPVGSSGDIQRWSYSSQHAAFIQHHRNMDWNDTHQSRQIPKSKSSSESHHLSSQGTSHSDLHHGNGWFSNKYSPLLCQSDTIASMGNINHDVGCANMVDQHIQHVFRTQQKTLEMTNQSTVSSDDSQTSPSSKIIETVENNDVTSTSSVSTTHIHQNTWLPHMLLSHQLTRHNIHMEWEALQRVAMITPPLIFSLIQLVIGSSTQPKPGISPPVSIASCSVPRIVTIPELLLHPNTTTQGQSLESERLENSAQLKKQVHQIFGSSAPRGDAHSTIPSDNVIMYDVNLVNHLVRCGISSARSVSEQIHHPEWNDRVVVNQTIRKSSFNALSYLIHISSAKSSSSNDSMMIGDIIPPSDRDALKHIIELYTPCGTR